MTLVASGEPYGLDIAVIKLRDPACISEVQREYVRPNDWPTRHVVEDEPVVIAGYPSALRGPEGQGLRIDANLVAETVASVSGRGFAITTNGNRATVRKNSRTPKVRQYGGMSGSGVFAFRGPGKDVEPVGLLYEVNEKWTKIILAIHLQFVRPDGSIDPDGTPASDAGSSSAVVVA